MVGPYMSSGDPYDPGPRIVALAFITILIGFLFALAVVAPLLESTPEEPPRLTTQTAPGSEPIETEVGP